MNKIFLKLLGTITVVSFLAVLGTTTSVQAAGSDYSSIKGKKILLDAGHGGKDPGAVQNNYMEKDLNMQLTEKVAEKLKSMGAEVIYTRQPDNDIFIDLVDRPIIANQAKPDLFISIHHNSNDSASPSGTSTHYSSFKPGVETNDVYVVYNNNKYKFLREAIVDGTRGFYINYNGSEKFVSVYQGTAFDPTPSEVAKKGHALSEKIAAAMASLGLKNEGAKDHNLYVTKATNMPSLLIEAGYISNVSEAEKLADPNFQNAMAEKISVSIAEYFNEYYPVTVPTVTGWVKDSNGKWFYYNAETGKFITGWNQINNTWYYFDSTGVMCTGFVEYSGKTYYLGSNGAMKTGWALINSKWYYFNGAGAMKTGWALISSKWYYFNGAGAMKTGWLKLGNYSYFLDANGILRTGWAKLGSSWYYFNAKGEMKIGWILVGNYWYYMYGDGTMAHDTIIDNKYKVGSDGAWYK